VSLSVEAPWLFLVCWLAGTTAQCRVRWTKKAGKDATFCLIKDGTFYPPFCLTNSAQMYNTYSSLYVKDSDQETIKCVSDSWHNSIVRCCTVRHLWVLILLLLVNIVYEEIFNFFGGFGMGYGFHLFIHVRMVFLFSYPAKKHLAKNDFNERCSILFFYIYQKL
jgi:hypothetical protein